MLAAFLFLGGSVDSPASAAPANAIQKRFHSLLETDASAAVAFFDSVLRTSELPSETLAALAAAHSTATGDSTLVRDLGIANRLERAAREAWFTARDQDSEAKALGGENQYAASVPLLQAAVATYSRAGDLRREAVARGSLGVAYFKINEWDRSRDAYLAALEARRRLGDQDLIGNSLNALGTVAEKTARYDEAMEYYEQARVVRERVGNPTKLASTITYIGHIHIRRGDVAAARKHYEEALQLFPADAALRWEATDGLANVHERLGEYEDALALYRELKQDFMAKENVSQAARACHNMATCLLDVGKFTDALRELEAARVVQDSLHDDYSLANTMSTYAKAWNRLGDPPREIRALAMAESLGRATQNNEIVAAALTSQGRVAVDAGNAAAAGTQLRAAIQYCRSLGLPVSPQLILLGMVEERSHRLDEALQVYKEGLEVAERSQPSDVPAVLINIGNVMNAQGKIADGRRTFTRATTMASRNAQDDVLWKALLGIGDGYEIAGQLDSARVYNDRALAVLERTWSPELAQSTKAGFVGKWAYVYETQVHVVARIHAKTRSRADLDAAFTVAERGKARALRDLLSEAQQGIDAGADPALVAERDAIDRSISALQYQLRRLVDDRAPEDVIRRLKGERDELERKRVQVVDRMRLQNPRLAALDVVDPPTIEKLQKTLLDQPKSVLLAYSLGDSASYLWAVTPTAVSMHTLAKRSEIEGAVRRMRDHLERPSATEIAARGLRLAPDADAAGAAGLIETAGTLYRLLLDPVRDLVEGATLCYLVPDGVLHFLPFEALARASSKASALADVQWALGNADVRYGPSATALALLADAQTKATSPAGNRMELLAVGDPTFTETSGAATVAALGSDYDQAVRSGMGQLPHTRDEVMAIVEALPPQRCTVLLGAQAQESALGELDLARYRVIHIASHGQADEAYPERSYVALAFPEDPSADGYLMASEVYGLRLDADLVVLSACQTGLGKNVRGEGVLGLPRAFLFAGARSVMVSLWNVADKSTSLLMREFYRAAGNSGVSSARALREARAVLRRDPAYAHPYYWAAFILMGPS